jgi:hypothetical protein
MSLFRPYVQEVTIPGLDGTASAGLGSDVNYPIRQRGFWLDGILLNCRVQAGGTPGTKTADYLRALIKRVELTADERTDGTRTIVSAPGAALIDFAKEVFGFEQEANVWSNQDTAANSSHNIVVPIIFRNPLLPEPNAYRTSLPLPRYGSDPILRVQIASATDISSTFSLAAGTGVLVRAIFLYREVIDPDNSFPHWKTELVTNQYTWPGTGSQAIEDLTQVGLLAYVHQQDFVGSSKAYCLSDPYKDEYQLEYRTRPIIRVSPYGARALSGYSQAYTGFRLLGGTVDAYQPTATLFYDLLSELTRSDVYHLGSTLDLSLNALKGGKLRLLGSNLQANARSRITTYKFLVDPAKALSRTL